MAYQPVTWGSEELITSTKLNQMATNQDIYRTKYISIANFIGKRATETNTSEQSYGSIKFYKPANCNTIQIYANIANLLGGTTTLKVYLNGTLQLTFTSTSTSVEEKSGTIDISTLAEGWHTLSLGFYTNDASKDAIFAGFNALLKLE